MTKETTTKFKVDISELKAGVQEANRQIALANSQFKEASAGMDNWRKSTEGISAKIQQLQTVTKNYNKILADLENEYEKVVNEQGENSKAAVDLQVSINNLKASIKGNTAQIAKYEQELSDLEKQSGEAEDASEDLADSFDDTKKAANDVNDAVKIMGDGFTVVKGAIASFIADGISNLISGIGNAVEESREYRKEMALLDTSFQTSNLSAENAKNTYTDLYGVLGDSGAATEAAQQLAKISKNEQDLEKNTRILTGVMGEYGSSIPTEGLAEGMAATAAMGEVQGVLADALEWQSINLEEYNKKLATMSSEEERAAYIQETLLGLYGDSADAYLENNAAVIEANRAQAEMTDGLAYLGAIVEPITTSFKLFGAELIKSVLPGFEEMGKGFTDLMNGVEGAGATIGNGLSNIINTLLTKVTELLPKLSEVAITLVTSLVTSIISALPQLVQTGVKIILNIMDGITQAIPQIVAAIADMIPQLVDTIVEAVPLIIKGIIKLVNSLVNSLDQILPPLIQAIPKLIMGIVNGILDNLPTLIDGIIQAVTMITQYLPDIISAILPLIPQIITAVCNSIAENLPVILEALINLTIMIATQILPQIIAEIVKMIPQIIAAVISGVATIFGSLIAKVGEWLGKLFSNVVNFVVGLVDSIKQFFAEMWGTIKNGAKSAWDFVVGVFEGVANWFNDNLIKPVAEFFTGMWDGLKNGASNAWTGIKEVFSKVASFFGEIFSKAWKKVKEIFSTGGKVFDGIKDGIVKAFTTVVNAIIRGINKVVKLPFEGLNKILDKLSGLSIAGVTPFSWIKWRAPIPQIPELKQGGVLKRGQVGLLEGDGAEAVVPLENNAKWIRSTARDLKEQMKAEGIVGTSGGPAVTNNNYNFTQHNTSPKPLSRLEIYRQTHNLLNFARG